MIIKILSPKKDFIKKLISKYRELNTNSDLFLEYKEKEKEIEKEETYFLSSKAQIITSEKDVIKFIKNRSILDKLEDLNLKESGKVVDETKTHIINIYKYKPLGGSSYIELPEERAGKRNGLLNIRNNDNMCFKWCHVANKYFQQEEIKTE